jgi:hypothetical protein
MARATKKLDADALLGEIVFVRSPIWQNGQRRVPAIITDATVDAVLLPERAIALVALTAFPPNSPSRTMLDIPLYRFDPDKSTIPAAWPKKLID